MVALPTVLIGSADCGCYKETIDDGTESSFDSESIPANQKPKTFFRKERQRANETEIQSGIIDYHSSRSG